jgi:hypothetical protein
MTRHRRDHGPRDRLAQLSQWAVSGLSYANAILAEVAALADARRGQVESPRGSSFPSSRR